MLFPMIISEKLNTWNKKVKMLKINVFVQLQRLLQFPCFMGFNHTKCPTENYKVYSLTLTSFSNKRTEAMLKPYTELTYNITVYSYHGELIVLCFTRILQYFSHVTACTKVRILNYQSRLLGPNNASYLIFLYAYN